MKKTKYIPISLILSFIIIVMAPFAFNPVYLYFNYTVDKYKWVDFRESFPEGTFVQAKFVVIGMYKEEGLIFNVPVEKLGAFERQLKQEINDSPTMENPQWDIYQLRVVTTKGRYTTAAFISEDRILFDTWMSENLRKLLCEWGYRDIKKD